MSELQINLLVIGIAVVCAVYIYSWWQQRKHLRRFGEAFEQVHEDALYHADPEKADSLDTLISFDDHLDKSLNRDLLPEDLMEHELPPDEPIHFANLKVTPNSSVCVLLNQATDYIAVLKFDLPASADSLVLLWQRRFDFGKNLHACGLNAVSGEWEKVIPESHLSYISFKISMQLADRSGPVSEVRLSDFRDLMRNIAFHLDAEAELPDVSESSARALELDTFCAEVDRMIGLNIMPSGDRSFFGGEVARVAEQYGMALQADGALHLCDTQGNTLFYLGNFEEIPFQHHTLPQMWIKGLTLLLDVPRVEKPLQGFDEMALLAQQIAMELRATVVDDHRVALGATGIAQIREQLVAIENKMLAGNIVPGSTQARRLFS
jgi:FtsZ-interacting cell division protein ZipA